MFSYRHFVQFYETDLMGIVHHSNYLRIFEEARVAWAHGQGLLDYQQPESAFQLAVYETQVKHLKPARFGDVVTVTLQACFQGVKLVFEYKMHRQTHQQDELLSECRTLHVPLDKNLKLIKPPLNLRKTLEKQSWTETWLSSL